MHRRLQRLVGVRSVRTFNCAVYVCHTSIVMIYIYIYIKDPVYMSLCMYIFFNVYIHIHIHVYMRIMHHICMYPYIIYISYMHYQFYTPIHTVYMQFHIWHMFRPYFLRKKNVASTVTSPAACSLASHFWNELLRHKCEGCETNILDFNLGFNEFCWIFCASTIWGQRYWNGQVSVLIISYHTLISSSSLYIWNQAPSCKYYVTIDTWFWP